MVLHIQTVSIDAAEPVVLGGFWSAVLGWTHRVDDDGDVWVEPGESHPDHGSAAPLLFLRVPDPKSVKNRLHLDLLPDDQEEEVERVVALGATRPSIGQTGHESWVVLADPEGNEFCILGEQ
jgi:predicted enzyme related to lactoylglutathione lyase